MNSSWFPRPYSSALHWMKQQWKEKRGKKREKRDGPWPLPEHLWCWHTEQGTLLYIGCTSGITAQTAVQPDDSKYCSTSLSWKQKLIQLFLPAAHCMLYIQYHFTSTNTSAHMLIIPLMLGFAYQIFFWCFPHLILRSPEINFPASNNKQMMKINLYDLICILH